MKFIIFLVVTIFLFTIKPIVVSSTFDDDLSIDEYNYYYKEAENNSSIALINLYAYYNLFYDKNSALMIICKGATLKEKTFQKLLLKEKMQRNDNSFCPKKPLLYLKNHSSWIPIEFRVLFNFLAN